MKAILVALMGLFIVGCGSAEKVDKGFLKQIESKAYDAAAKTASEYAKYANSSELAKIERNQARREIRQRGEYGPAGPSFSVPGLDHKTAHGKGPIVRIWAEGEEVPDCIWPDLVRQRN